MLPLHWSDGDVVSVFIGERNGRTIVHDACKIKGELFRAEEKGVSPGDLGNVVRAVKALEVQFDHNTGIAFAEVDPENLLYWLMEMGRIMTMVPHMYPRTRCRGATRGPLLVVAIALSPPAEVWLAGRPGFVEALDRGGVRGVLDQVGVAGYFASDSAQCPARRLIAPPLRR